MAFRNERIHYSCVCLSVPTETSKFQIERTQQFCSKGVNSVLNPLGRRGTSTMDQLEALRGVVSSYSILCAVEIQSVVILLFLVYVFPPRILFRSSFIDSLMGWRSSSVYWSSARCVSMQGSPSYSKCPLMLDVLKDMLT